MSAKGIQNAQSCIWWLSVSSHAVWRHEKFKEACNEHLFLLSDANGEIRDKLLKCQQHTESSTLIFAQKLVEYLWQIILRQGKCCSMIVKGHKEQIKKVWAGCKRGPSLKFLCLFLNAPREHRTPPPEKESDNFFFFWTHHQHDITHWTATPAPGEYSAPKRSTQKLINQHKLGIAFPSKFLSFWTWYPFKKFVTS